MEIRKYLNFQNEGFIPDKLLEIKDYLNSQKNKYDLLKGGDSPRQDSARSERQIISFLQNGLNSERNFKIYSPNISSRNNTSWYDVEINDYFCDIKISDLKRSDNTGAKQAIYYFLTGITTPAPAQQKAFFKKLSENETACEKRDFYYIIINKTTKDVEILSLKNLTGLKPNPKNQPFQCNWTIAIKEQKTNNMDRTWEEARKFLLSKWATSISKEIENSMGGMLKHYSQFFNSFHLID